VDRSAIFSLLLVTDNIIATGDDEGTLKVVVVFMSLLGMLSPCFKTFCSIQCILACTQKRNIKNKLQEIKG